MDLDAHVPAARHVEIAWPAARTRQNVAGRRNDFRPHVRDTRANAASEQSIASGQAIAAPRTRNINDRDAQGAHGLTMISSATGKNTFSIAPATSSHPTGRPNRRV